VWKFNETAARYWRAFISGEGNASVTVTSTGMTGTPITLSVPVESLDTANMVAKKIKTALLINANITPLYDVSVSGADVILTAKNPVANVSNLNISVMNGTCAGLNYVASSANTVAGVAAVKQQENINITGTVGTSGNAKVIVTASQMTNSPITFLVPVTSGDTASVVATKVNAALRRQLVMFVCNANNPQIPCMQPFRGVSGGCSHLIEQPL